jgi:hypothetical protein
MLPPQVHVTQIHCVLEFLFLILKLKKKRHCQHIPHATFKWLAILRIRVVRSSNLYLETGYTESALSWFSSVSPENLGIDPQIKP